MANDILQDITNQIEDFSQRYGYKLGWRFLTCSKSILETNPKIVFFNLNPRGRKQRPEHQFISCDNGSPYLYERWGDNEPGEDNLQIQIQKMFGKICEKTNYSGSNSTFIEAALSGYFVPFRSASLRDLEHEEEAFIFGEKLWSKILRSIQPPKLFVCIDRKTTKHVRKIIAITYNNLHEGKQCELETGWGKISAEIFEFGETAETRLLRLPHLSRFKLFTSEKCKEEIDNVFTRFCRKT